jgi:hypothetical protein
MVCCTCARLPCFWAVCSSLEVQNPPGFVLLVSICFNYAFQGNCVNVFPNFDFRWPDMISLYMALSTFCCWHRVPQRKSASTVTHSKVESTNKEPKFQRPARPVPPPRYLSHPKSNAHWSAVLSGTNRVLGLMAGRTMIAYVRICPPRNIGEAI